jgi:hypothetical protein
MEGASAEAKVEMQASMDKLKAWGDEVDRDMENIGDNMETGWEAFKNKTRTGLNNINRELKDMFDDDAG